MLSEEVYEEISKLYQIEKMNIQFDDLCDEFSTLIEELDEKRNKYKTRNRFYRKCNKSRWANRSCREIIFDEVEK